MQTKCATLYINIHNNIMHFRWATRTDNGVSYTWDVTRSMFCPGNITEKMRVAGFDCSESRLELGQLLKYQNW